MFNELYNIFIRKQAQTSYFESKLDLLLFILKLALIGVLTLEYFLKIFMTHIIKAAHVILSKNKITYHD